MPISPNESPRNAPYPPAQPVAAKRSRLFYFGLAGLIAGGTCCILGAVALIFSYVLNKQAAPAAVILTAATPAETALPATSTPLPASLPTNTSLPVSTATTALQSTGGNATQFTDNFSKSNSGWMVVSTDASDESYNSLGFYEMGVKQADSYIVSLPPYNLAKPVKNILIHVRAQPAVGDTGQYGVVCRYQDNDNFYLAGISRNRFYIGKLVKGKWNYLTSPGWQNLPNSTPDADGYQVISMSCIDAFIVLEVNGIGAAHVADEEFSTGDVGLCVWAGDTAGRGGYFAQAAFDDFSAELPK